MERKWGGIILEKTWAEVEQGKYQRKFKSFFIWQGERMCQWNIIRQNLRVNNKENLSGGWRGIILKT